MIINGLHDDVKATLWTGFTTYGLWWLLPLGMIIAALLMYLMHRLVMDTPLYELKVQGLVRKTLVWIIAWVLIIPAAVGMRFGGAFEYAHSLNWENEAQLSSHLLNEAILDDGQALQRVKGIYERMRQQRKISITEGELRREIALVGGNPKAATIDEAFTKVIGSEQVGTPTVGTSLPTNQTDVPKLGHVPQNIIFILGESYGQWPFLPAYDDVGSYIAQEGRKLAQSPQAMTTNMLLAHGTGTMPAVNGYVSGLADTGIYTNYEPQSYKALYGTGIAQMMKHLGYKTVFWYAGFGTWQGVENFVLAQGFDEFHGATSFPYTDGNAWGARDGDLYQAIESYMAKEPAGEKVFHFILTSSNHPPYTVNLEAESFDPSQLIGKGNDSIGQDEKTLREMGHFWYADHTMGAFVKWAETHDPSSLFIITGDHSERFSFAKEVDTRTYSSIPLIIYGKGVHKDWLKPNAFGSALQVAPTIAELVGMPGMTYESLVPSLFGQYHMSFNHRLYIDETGMYEQKNLSKEYSDYIKALRDISSWRIVRGNAIH